MLICHNTQEEKEEEEENDRMKFLIYIKQQPKNERHVQFNRIHVIFIFHPQWNIQQKLNLFRH